MPMAPSASAPKFTVTGQEHLPAQGGCLILPNRLDLAAWLVLKPLLAGRPVTFLMDQGAALEPALQAHLESEHASVLVIDAENTDPHVYRKAVTEETDKGTVIVYLPAVAAALPAPLCTVPGARLDFLVKTGCPILPVFLQHLDELSLAIEAGSGRTLAIGRLLRDDEATLAAYQESLFELSEAAFSRHPLLDRHLAYALLQGLKRHGKSNRVIDGKDDKELGYDMVLALAIALSKVIQKETQKPRVGVILPPGIGGLVANIAVLLAGKTPVNLNFTAGRSAVEYAIRAADLDRFVTADIFVRKMQGFPWPPMKQLLLLERLLPTLKNRIAAWLVVSKLLPVPLLAALLGVPRKGGRKEAILLFTSGSSGDPKGVALTHRNVLANVIQFSSRLGLSGNDSILGCLPLFHSFGCTVTLWYPILAGLDLVTYPSPLETKRLAELVEQHQVSLMIATPTFLRGYLRGINREALASLKLVVTGAEKLPATVAQAFEQRFGKRVLEGYGLTETSPVSNVNLPDPVPLGDDNSGRVWLPAHRPGSVGQVIPGLALRITDPETGDPQPLHQSGMIWFKGANVFEGYLNDPKRSAEVIDENGWFRTGDIGRVDLDGFLYIEGRLSRFSKIGGEMVPHETVEEAIIRALGLENETARRIAVVGVPDPDKGEALILLSALPAGAAEQQELVDLRYRLLEKGIPALWIPKKLVRVPDIPILSSGKLDVQSCEKIARPDPA